jgi:hypothetical protein
MKYIMVSILCVVFIFKQLYYWIRKYGIPQALYCDHKNAFMLTREATDAELLQGITKPNRHFGNASEKLGEAVIPASSP